MSTMMERLLALELEEPETVQVKITRLSKQLGEEVVFTLKEPSYRRAKSAEDGELQLLLECVTEPDLRDPKWFREKMGCESPVDAVKKLLRPGEVVGLVRKIDELTGYRGLTLEAVTKN